MAEELQHRWTGKNCTKLTRCTADQIWPLLEDYCSINKWIPACDACHHVEGTPAPGQPGCIRYCTGHIPFSDGQGTISGWAYEKLVAMDPTTRHLSYRIDANENNLGFDDYVATFKVLSGGVGCEIEWTFVANPMKGWRLEDFVALLSSNLQVMARRMDDYIHGLEMNMVEVSQLK